MSGAAPPLPGRSAPTGSVRLVAGLVGLAGVLGLVTILRHEWWRDEAFTWLAVRESSSLADLLAHLGFNGHPRAYYLLAYGLHRLWPSPLALSLSNLAFALLAIGLVARSAPLPVPHKALFSLGFFPLYQYGVIARSYSLFLFLLFLYAHLKTRRSGPDGWRLLCLALLAQIHLLSLAAAAVLFFLELTELRSRRGAWTTATWLAAATVGLSLAGAVYQILPRGPGQAVLDRNRVLFVQGFANGYFPHFDRWGGPWEVGVGLVLFALSWAAASQDRRILVRYALLCAPVVSLCAFVYVGHRWHHGFYFIYFLVAFWVSGAPSPRCVRLLGVVLALHAAVGVHAIVADLYHPYSNGAEAARAIRAQGLTGLPLLGVGVWPPDGDHELRYAFQIDEIQPVLLDLPGSRVYNPRSGTYEAYWTHYAEPRYFPFIRAADLLPQLREISARLGGPLLIVTVQHDLADGVEPAPPPLRRLAGFPRTLDYGEQMGIYLFPGE